MEPGRMWMVIALITSVFVGHRLYVNNFAEPGVPVATLHVPDGITSRRETIAASDCVAKPDRIWIETKTAPQCLAFVGPAPSASDTAAVLFFQGDMKDEQRAEEMSAATKARYTKLSAELTSRYNVPVIIVGRLGLMGSTGVHFTGGSRIDAEAMNQAVDAIKRLYNLRWVALAGQSGGARIAAQLLILGRNDINCTAMASGAYDLPTTTSGGTVRTNVFGEPGANYMVPMHNVDAITRSSSRRDFVIADPNDKISPFAEQRAWSERLYSKGHSVKLIEVRARDSDNHGLGLQAMRAAALCAKGARDDEIVAALRPD
jgi:predicted esterase